MRFMSPDQSNKHLPAHGLVPVYVGHELHHRPQQGSLCPHVGGNPHAEQLTPLHTVAQLVADKCHKSQIKSKYLLPFRNIMIFRLSLLHEEFQSLVVCVVLNIGVVHPLHQHLRLLLLLFLLLFLTSFYL